MKMKSKYLVYSSLILALALAACKHKSTETESKVIENTADTTKTSYLFVDVHNLEPGKVTFEAVAEAHQKDLATQGRYGVRFLKYWVDEAQGKVYCLSESADSAAVYHTHQAAHGLVPARVERVSDGVEAAFKSGSPLFLDVHHVGAGKVKAQDVADAHVKDLAIQDKYHVNLINYWVDEKQGIVMCLAEAPNAEALIHTHKDAHGLVPDEVHQVKEGH
jgi:hypothetical protein